MEKRVFSDDEVNQLLSQFVAVKIDGRANRALAQELSSFKSTKYVPEVVFINARRKVLGRLESTSDPRGAADEIRAALERNKLWSGDK